MRINVNICISFEHMFAIFRKCRRPYKRYNYIINKHKIMLPMLKYCIHSCSLPYVIYHFLTKVASADVQGSYAVSKGSATYLSVPFNSILKL